MAGRPKGSKDPNRRRILNPNGRRIDFEGRQYNKWIKNGYKLNRDGTKLVIDKSFTVTEMLQGLLEDLKAKQHLYQIHRKLKILKLGD